MFRAVRLDPRVLLMLLALALAAASPAPAAPPAGYLSATLPNGLRVSILPDPLNPVVATQVWYHVGSANEEPRTRGFAHLFEHLMFGGTTLHPKRDYWDLHYRHGGDENAYTSFDETVYLSEIAPEASAPLLALEADRMVNLSLNQENLDNEKRIVTEELRLGTENDPINRLAFAMMKKVLGEHPYAPTPIGTKEDIAAATLDHAREFYADYYRPRNAHLVIVGPVDGPATLAGVERLFGPLPADGRTPAEVPSLTEWTYPAEADFSEDIPPVEVAILGFPLPPPGQEDHWPLLVMRRILGGQAAPFREELVRRRHRAIEAGIFAEEVRRGGILAFYAVNLPYRRRATAFRDMEQARQVLARMEWLTPEAFEGARRALLREELERVYRPDQRAEAIGRAAWWLGDERLAFEAADRLEALTRQDVEAVFRKYVVDPAPVRVYIRPEHVPLLVRLFGWLYPLVAG